MPITRDDALALDAADPLARFRAEFVTPDGLIYLDGNSLGMAPRRTRARLDAAFAEWSSDLIGGWDRWLGLPRQVGDRLCPLLGARPGEVIVHDSTTVSLYQLVRAALALRPERHAIAVDPADFPTDRYVVEGVARDRGLEVRHGFDDLRHVALAVRSLVDYRTAEVADLAADTAHARDAGALVIWDLSHAAGAIEVDLEAAGVDLAVGCTYKFLNGGPGSPAWTFVRASLQGAVANPIQGWFGHRDQFAMADRYEPAPEIERLLVGTSGVLGLVAAEVGIELVLEAGIAAIAAKTRALTRFALDLCDQLGLDSPTPRDDRRRGGHIAVRLPAAEAVTRRLAERRVVTDFRPPDLVRLGLSPLTTRFVDVYDGVAVLADEGASNAAT